MILSQFINARESASTKFAVLIDPEKSSRKMLEAYASLAAYSKIDFFFLGGSMFGIEELNFCLDALNEVSNIPKIIFPGNSNHISEKADALLFLNLISGRNPEYLIGQQLAAATQLKNSNLEIVPTAYMLIDERNTTSVSYVSNTSPIPASKIDIAKNTAFAGELMGNKLIYMDAGSGAEFAIAQDMIATVKSYINVPLVVGGGIRNPKMAQNASNAGADVIVVGNVLEKDPMLIADIADALN